jgi:cytochrome c553
MNTVSIRWAVPAAILALVWSGVGRAGESDWPKRFPGSKVGYCTDCHGTSGRGYYGYYPMPRIAGQTTEYLVSQLRAFAERRRGRNMAMNMARVHGLSTGTRNALAVHFNNLDPRPIGWGPRRLVARGKQIYDEGIPEANVPACAACHGPEAMGNGENPRLAGQLYFYTIKVLLNWNRDRGLNNDKAAIMRPILRNLSKSEIAAVAAYVSSLR